MTRRFWTTEEIEYLRRHYPTTETKQIAASLGRPLGGTFAKADNLGLKKDPEWLRQNTTARLHKSSKKGQFAPGHATWNKGKPHPASGRSAETQFKPGHMPRFWRPVGNTRVNKDGYLERKTADTGITWRDYVGVHHLVWRMHGRTVPPGHALVFRDGDKRNFDINNLELVTRAQLMARNSTHRHGPEIAQISQLIGAIHRQLNQKERHAQP